MDEKIYVSGFDNFDEIIDEYRMILVDKIEDADYVFLQKQTSGLLAEEQFRTLVRSKELDAHVEIFESKQALNSLLKEKAATYNTRERMDMEME